MRCKNCGTENDDNRYICETCGSPLYDEDEFGGINDTGAQQTQTFNALNNGEILDLGITPDVDYHSDESKPDEKKSVIVIAILVVVLVAIIASVIVVAHSKSKMENDTTESTTISTTASTTHKKPTESTTKETTEATTESTTTTTTKSQIWSIKLISQGGGTVEGSGSYNDGDNVTIIANADDGYEFEGWYSNETKLSSTAKYSFTATTDITISAVFNIVTTASEPVVEEIEDLDGGMD